MNHSEKLFEIIAEKVFVNNTDEHIALVSDPEAWLFDFRRVLMNGKTADIISELFYNEFKDDYPFQLCALEIAGVPLLTSFMSKFYFKGIEDINAFFIRKSRKKTGLMRMIEGEVQDKKKIILVDDIMNSGDSFWRQITLLEELGYTVDTVWSVLRYRDLDHYTRFHDKGITIKSLFTLDDFTTRLNGRVENFPEWKEVELPMPFTVEWIFKSENPSYNWVTNKSQPVLDEDKIYFGADNRTFWAINQSDGSVAWKYKVGPQSFEKSILSSPAIYRDLVIFGAYDGTVYALERATGKVRWKFYEADWVGSSPSVSYDMGIVYIGLEFGLFKKYGGIVALDAQNGKKLWADYAHPTFTHASPLYIKRHKQVVIGSNDGVVRMYHARNGGKMWEFTTYGGSKYDPTKDFGFGEGDIKESCAYDEKRDLVVFGSLDGNLYILKRKTGELAHRYECEFGVYGTPCIYHNRVYFTSLDKRLRCIDLTSFELVFEVEVDNTRIFSSPTVINDKLYVGTNAARLHELDPNTGKKLGYFQALERITNTLLYNKKNDRYFLPTYANEIIKLRRE